MKQGAAESIWGLMLAGEIMIPIVDWIAVPVGTLLWVFTACGFVIFSAGPYFLLAVPNIFIEHGSNWGLFSLFGPLFCMWRAMAYGMHH